jgi:hypothetical protein
MMHSPINIRFSPEFKQKFKIDCTRKAQTPFLISNFHRVLNVVCFLLGNSSVSEFYTRYLDFIYKFQMPGNYPEESIQHKPLVQTDAQLSACTVNIMDTKSVKYKLLNIHYRLCKYVSFYPIQQQQFAVNYHTDTPK